MKKYKVTRYFDGYPEDVVYCTCDTIEEARLKREEANKLVKNRPYTDYHILVYGDEKFNNKPYRTE